MSFFRITVCLRPGVKVRFTALFLDGKEAREQTMADYPQARAITFICFKGEAANA